MTEEATEIVETKTAWTDDEADTAIIMWTHRVASTEIAIVVNKTRNAVIGRMNRLGHKWGSALEPDDEPMPIEVPEPTPEPVRIPEPEPVPEPVHQPEPEPIRPVSTFIPPSKGIPLLQAGMFACRFPLFKGDEPIEHKYVCGDPVKGITSWCEVHFHVVFEPARPRRK